MQGEAARALDVLSVAHRYLLWMARLAGGKTQHWPSPARSLERDLNAESHARYLACTAPADRAPLVHAYQSAWAWSLELAAELAPAYGTVLPAGLAQKIGERLDALTSSSVGSALS
jgi:lincosamide nucleotidyltransferase